MVSRNTLSQLLNKYDQDVQFVIGKVVRLEQEHINLELQHARLREPITKIIDEAIRQFPVQTEGAIDEA